MHAKQTYVLNKAYLRFFIAVKPSDSSVIDHEWILLSCVPRIIGIVSAEDRLLTAVGIQLEPKRYGHTKQRFPNYSLSVNQNIAYAEEMGELIY